MEMTLGNCMEKKPYNNCVNKTKCWTIKHQLKKLELFRVCSQDLKEKHSIQSR